MFLALVQPYDGTDAFTSEIDKANLYTRSDKAERVAHSLFPDHETVVVPVRIIMSPVFHKAPSAQNHYEAIIKHFRELAKEFDEMSYDDADRLSKSQLKKYRNARQMIAAYDSAKEVEKIQAARQMIAEHDEVTMADDDTENEDDLDIWRNDT